jgi:transposase
LRDKGFVVLVLQPIQVKAYARVHLRRAKNDKLDTALIAACAATIDRPRIEPDDRLARLAQHLTFVEQLEEDIARFKVRLEHVGDPRLRRMVVADIPRLKARRSAELLRIVTALRAHDDLAHRLDLVSSVPDIGERTALAAPYDDDSGKHKGQRHIAGGRGRLRRSLFAAALPAAFRWNKALINLYTRLVAHGKAHNTALIACARKLLIYANTVVYRGTPWIERLAVT